MKTSNLVSALTFLSLAAVTCVKGSGGRDGFDRRQNHFSQRQRRASRQRQGFKSDDARIANAAGERFRLFSFRQSADHGFVSRDGRLETSFVFLSRDQLVQSITAEHHLIFASGD
jgi:hypothetical protein